MKRCRTKVGVLRLRHEGEDFVLDGNGLDLPDELAESIRSHVNVVVEDVVVETPSSHHRQARRRDTGDPADE